MSTLITGGTKGIGLAIAEYVARRDEQLVLAYHSDTAAATAAMARLASTGARVSTVKVNVGDVDDVGRLMEGLPDDGGPLPVVIMLMDAPGVREGLREICRRISQSGYYVLLPNMFYTYGRGQVMTAAEIFSPEGRPRIMQMIGTNTPEKLMPTRPAYCRA